MDYVVVLAAASVAVGLAAFIPYFRDIARRRTKPHAFSWFVWSVIMSISFFASLSKGGGYGAYAVGGTAAACLAVFVASLFRGEREITLVDGLSLAAALFGIVLWTVTSDPAAAVIIVTLVDAVGFIPTFRKSYWKPGQETLLMYALNAAGLAMSLFALQAVSLTTVLYPASVVVTNAIFVTVVMARRVELRGTVRGRHPSEYRGSVRR